MPRESISTPSGASCRRPIPTSRHKKGNPVTPMCLVRRYVCAVMLYSPQSRFCAAPSRPPLFLPQSFPCPQCCRAVISPAAFMRLHFGAPRRASLLRRSFLAAAFSAAILALSQCCRAVISPATAFMRLHIDAPRRASLPCCRLVPGDGRECTWPECRQQEVPALRPGLPGP